MTAGDHGSRGGRISHTEPGFSPSASGSVGQSTAAGTGTSGNGVATDFQSALIDRLREDVAGHTVRQRELLDRSRANLTIQTRVHECVLAILDARSFEKVIETIATDFTVLLDLDAAALCIEAQDGGWSGGAAAQGLRVVPTGTVGALLGATEDATLP